MFKSFSKNLKNTVVLNAVGIDRPGIEEAIDKWILKHKGNLIDGEYHQKKLYKEGPKYFVTHKVAEIEGYDEDYIKRELTKICNKLQMKSKILFEDERKTKKVILLTTKEKHCVEALLKHQSDLSIEIIGIIGTEETMKPLATEYSVNFHLVNIPDRLKHDQLILDITMKTNPDFLILPRYIRKITDPEFLWLYKNLIINIHPSILPSFPWGDAYTQADEEKVHVHGATAHFIDKKMDKGPIICQEPYKRMPNETFESFRSLGRKLEVKTLLTAVYLFANNAICVRDNEIEYKKPDMFPIIGLE